MSDGIPCPLCGNGKLIAPPSVETLEDVATNYYVVTRAQYEALMGAAKALAQVDEHETLYWAGRDIFDPAESGSNMAADAMRAMRDALAALRSAGIEETR